MVVSNAGICEAYGAASRCRLCSVPFLVPGRCEEWAAAGECKVRGCFWALIDAMPHVCKGAAHQAKKPFPLLLSSRS